MTHGLPIYNRWTDPPAILLHHQYFVSAYSPELKQPLWTAAQVSPEKVRHATESDITALIKATGNLIQTNRISVFLLY